MKNRKMRVIILSFNDDETELEVKIDTIKDDLNVFYKIIKCNYIDIVKRKIGKKYYNIICDDEGLLFHKAITLYEKNDIEALVGNLIITGKETDDGELTGLTDDEVDDLIKHFSHKGLVYEL